jgi:hypothetical protein
MKTKQRLAHLIVVVVLLHLFTSCRGAPGEPVAPAQPTQTLDPATATPQDPAAPSATNTPPAPALQFDLPLPAGWISQTMPIDQIEQQLSGAAGIWTEQVRKRAAYLATRGDIGALQVAWLADENDPQAPMAHLIALSVPAHGLRLPAVLSATVESLMSTPEVQINDAHMQPGLRERGMPVAIIEYSAATTTITPANRQYVIADLDSDRLLVLTFSSRAQKMVELAAQFDEIVRNATFHEQ